jgi:hypothetical protein
MRRSATRSASREIDMGEDSVIVFLDDDANRTAVLYQRMAKKDQERTFWVQTADETLDMLKRYRERLDIVSLDHDLGGETYVHTGREDCGMEVVRWLEKQEAAQYAHVRFVIHSWNIPAGQKMTARLRACGYRVIQSPFGTNTHG